MLDRKWIQIGGLAGILFVALIVASSVVAGNIPSIDASTSKIAAYVIDHRHAFLISGVLGLAGSAIVLWFVGTLAGILRVRDEHSPLGLIVLASGASAAVAGGLSSVTTTVLAFMAVQPEGLKDASVTRMLFDLSSGPLFGVLLFMLALFLIALGIAMIRRTFAASWLGWLSAALAIVNVVGSVVMETVSNDSAIMVVSYVALIGFGVIVLVTSIFMLRYRERVSG